MTTHRWNNWAHTETAQPARIARPATTDDVASTVREAAEAGLRVKAVGTGHSFSGIAVTDGALIDLACLSGITQADVDTGLVTVLAGTPLHRLSCLLDDLGLALPNLGDVDRQTVAGAISTGTHGTGRRHRGLASQVHALELVLADGTVATCSADDRADLFAAARVGLGALGVLTKVTLQCVPAFLLHADERPMPLPQVLDDLDHFVDANDHFEFYWFPHTTRALTKRNNRVHAGAPARPLGRLRAWFDDELLSNDVFDMTNRAVSAFPRLTPAANAVVTRALTARTYTDRSHRVFVSPRRVVFREMEYAVPRASVRDLLLAVQRWIDTSGEQISFPMEVRFAAADDVWLSTAYGRETAYLAVHQFHRRPYQRYFRAVEKIAADHDGRPHWGKLHWLDAETLRARYPRLADFTRVRERFDPTGTFANAYLDRVLGPVGLPAQGRPQQM
jgi:L-gulono-1,4-lactone dehydrogenase